VRIPLPTSHSPFAIRPSPFPIRPSLAYNRPNGAKGLAAIRNMKRGGARKASDAIERACRESGLRMTGQRTIIAQVLDRAEDHPDVVELHRRAAAVDERISLSTVYRTVKLFESKGILERLDFRDSRALRAGGTRAPRPPHQSRDRRRHRVPLRGDRGAPNRDCPPARLPRRLSPPGTLRRAPRRGGRMSPPVIVVPRYGLMRPGREGR